MDCFFTIPSAIILEVSGKDSARYLNARLTNDIKKLLSPDRAVLAAALNPQGKTQALFTVSGDLASKVTLVCDAGDKDSVIAAFKKYLVADRVDVEDRSQALSLIHIIGDKSVKTAISNLKIVLGEPTEYRVITSSNCRAILRHRSNQLGIDVLVANETLPSLTAELRLAGATELSPKLREYYRISAGIPAFPSELNEEILFSESGLTSAVSFNKGCYTGQEVVEKVDSHGKLSKTLKLIQSNKSQPAQVGDKVSQETSGDVIGKVLSVASDEQTGISVAFIQVKNDSNLWQSDVLINGNVWRFNP